jgi:hypothetical protein
VPVRGAPKDLHCPPILIALADGAAHDGHASHHVCWIGNRYRKPMTDDFVEVSVVDMHEGVCFVQFTRDND